MDKIKMLLNVPIVAAFLEDDFSSILIIGGIALIVPMLIGFLYHAIAMLIIIIKQIIRLIIWVWRHCEHEVKVWYYKDFLRLFKRRE